MIACVRLPHFAASLAARAEPDAAGQPLVLVDATAGDACITGASAEAATQGIRPGMRLAQAQARCDGLLVRPAVHSRTQRALDDLLAALTTFTPQVEAEQGLALRADGRQRRTTFFLPPSQVDDYPAATCYLDLGKLTDDEVPTLATQLRDFVSARAGIPASVGLSSGKFPARVAALAVEHGTPLIVPSDAEADFLARFTVALLPIDGETLRQLDLLGLHTLGGVAAQPVAALLNRFGKMGRILHRLASGRDTSRVTEYAPPQVAHAQRDFAGPLSDWARLDAALDALLDDATAALLDAGQTVRHLALVLTLDDHATLERQVTLRTPSTDPAHLRATVREMARSLAVTSGVVEAELALSDIAPAVPRQLSLFERPPVPQEHLSTVLKDLVARYGAAHFVRAHAADRDARLPEQRYRWEEAADR